MKKLLTLALTALLCAALALPAMAADTAATIYTGTFTVDGKVADGEYGTSIASLSGEGKAYWTAYYQKQNGAAADSMNEALLPDALTLYAGYDANGLYIACVVDTDAYFNTADAAFNAYTHLRLFFDKADASKWDALLLRPDASGAYVTSDLSMKHFGTTAVATRDDAAGTITYEAYYKWESILSTFKTAGAPADGDKVNLQALFMPAASKETAYFCYLNPIGTTETEQTSGTGNVYPITNWYELTLGGAAPAPSAPSASDTPDTPSAPATFDAGIIAGAIALASAAGVVVSKKRK